MARVLIAWELGGGLGHIMQIRPFVSALVDAGHHVFIAIRNLSAMAAGAFGRLGVVFLQAPHKSGGAVRFPRSNCFAHVLANVGFGDPKELFALGCAWRSLFGFVRPKLSIFDHSPTALLATRGLPMRRVIIGSGFCCPPAREHLPTLSVASSPQQVENDLVDEHRVLENANRLLAHWGVPQLSRLSTLYADVDETVLLTLSELDHFGPRDHVEYHGPFNAVGGKRPDWPDGTAARVFAYLKQSPQMVDVLRVLGEMRVSALAYVDGLGRRAAAQGASEGLRITTEPIDLSIAANDCHCAITHAGHGATAQFLLAGKPVVMLPLVQEQTLLANRVQQFGAGFAASLGERHDQFVQRCIQVILGNGSHAQAAQGLAARYAAFDFGRARGRAVNRAMRYLT